MSNTNGTQDTPEGHAKLPEGKYRYGEGDEFGILPVFGAHDQLLWYSAPNSKQRFDRLSEAINFTTSQTENARLQSEVERLRDEHLACIQANAGLAKVISDLQLEGCRLRDELAEAKADYRQVCKLSNAAHLEADSLREQANKQTEVIEAFIQTIGIIRPFLAPPMQDSTDLAIAKAKDVISKYNQ